MRVAFTWIPAVITSLLLASQVAVAAVPAISAAATGRHEPGKLLWADLMTDDVEAATRFYGAVFGWEFLTTDEPGYTQVANGGRPIAGLVLHEPRDPEVSEVQWLISISVDDPDAAADTATRLGGQVYLPPEEFPERGRHTVIGDPAGAAVTLLRTSGGDPADETPQPNDWLFAELYTHDPSAMADFYRQVVGYTVTRDGDYLALVSGGRIRTGIVKLPWDEVAPNWTAYILVEDIDDTVASVRANGGAVLLAPDPNLEDGSVAIVADPTGGVVALQERRAGQ